MQKGKRKPRRYIISIAISEANNKSRGTSPTSSERQNKILGKPREEYNRITVKNIILTVPR